MPDSLIAALIEERGLKPLFAITEKELGGWPAVKGDSWDEENWTWVGAVKKFRKLGYSMDYILDFSVGIDLKNSTQRTIDVSGEMRRYDGMFQAYNGSSLSTHIPPPVGPVRHWPEPGIFSERLGR